MHRLSIGEIHYLTVARRGREEAASLLGSLRRLPWDLGGPLSYALLTTAAELKVAHGVPYVDAVAGAWAIHNDAELATTDHAAFDAASRAGVLDVVFLR